jgi:hypothetical protein
MVVGPLKWKERAQAACVHLTASLAVAALAALLVFVVWFPFPYREISGGRALFELLVAVDLTLGPLLTFVVFNRAKPRRELWRDLSVIAVLQLAALGYGLHAVYQARPVYLVYEVDRFQVVTAADVDPSELGQAPPDLRELPWHGVQVIGARKSRDSDEMLRSLESALAGKDIAMMPSRWQSLGADEYAQIRARARPAKFLRGRGGDGVVALDRLLGAAGLTDEDVLAVPLVSRRNDWSVLMRRRDLQIIGYLAIDAF